MPSGPPLPSVSLLPGMLPNEELFWHWRTAISPYFESVPLADPRNPPQVPEVHLYNAGGFLFFDSKLSRQKFVRDAAWLRRNDDADHVGLQVYLRGGNRIENGGRGYVMQPRDTYAVNLGYEIDAACTDAEVLSVVLPRDLLADHLPALHDARGPLFAGDSTAGRLFVDFMVSMRRNLPISSVADAPILSHTLLGLLRALVGAEDPVSVEARRGVFDALRTYIDDNLGTPDLGVAHLCARFRISRATLYRLFQGEGGVRDYILRRRLMACFRALSSPAHAGRGIFDIALDFGFISPSHLSARFREHFGMSPSEVREAAAGRPVGATVPKADLAPDGLSSVEIMQRWMQRLSTGAERARAAAPAPA